MHDYKEFLRALHGEPGRVTLAEPFIPRVIAEQLIWRRGKQLWDTPEHYVSTLCELYAYIKADVVFIDTRSFDARELVSYSHLLPNQMKFVAVADNLSMNEAIADDSICAVISEDIGTAAAISEKLCVYLCRDRDDSVYTKIEDAAREGFAGIYLPLLDEKIIEAAYDRGIMPMGGVGTEHINKTQPLDIYNRIERLTEKGLRMVGSGGFGESVEYLGFISLLGKYAKLI